MSRPLAGSADLDAGRFYQPVANSVAGAIFGADEPITIGVDFSNVNGFVQFRIEGSADGRNCFYTGSGKGIVEARGSASYSIQKDVGRATTFSCFHSPYQVFTNVDQPPSK